MLVIFSSLQRTTDADKYRPELRPSPRPRMSGNLLDFGGNSVVALPDLRRQAGLRHLQLLVIGGVGCELRAEDVEVGKPYFDVLCACERSESRHERRFGAVIGSAGMEIGAAGRGVAPEGQAYIPRKHRDRPADCRQQHEAVSLTGYRECKPREAPRGNYKPASCSLVYAALRTFWSECTTT